MLKEKEISVQCLSDLPERCFLSPSVCGHISCLLAHEIPVSVSLFFLCFSRHHCLFLTIFAVNSVDSCSCLKLRSLLERGNSSLMCHTFFAEVQCLFLFCFFL